MVLDNSIDLWNLTCPSLITLPLYRDLSGAYHSLVLIDFYIGFNKWFSAGLTTDGKYASVKSHTSISKLLTAAVPVWHLWKSTFSQERVLKFQILNHVRQFLKSRLQGFQFDIHGYSALDKWSVLKLLDNQDFRQRIEPKMQKYWFSTVSGFIMSFVKAPGADV